MQEVSLICAICSADSGTSLVCPVCLPLLTPYQRDKMMKTWHRVIIERDGNKCVYCDHSATTDSGELCGNHNPTKAAAPDKIFDVTLHECICKPCNSKFSYTAPMQKKKPRQQNLWVSAGSGSLPSR